MQIGFGAGPGVVGQSAAGRGEAGGVVCRRLCCKARCGRWEGVGREGLLGAVCTSIPHASAFCSWAHTFACHAVMLFLFRMHHTYAHIHACRLLKSFKSGLMKIQVSTDISRSCSPPSTGGQGRGVSGGGGGGSPGHRVTGWRSIAAGRLPVGHCTFHLEHAAGYKHKHTGIRASPPSIMYQCLAGFCAKPASVSAK